MKRIYTFIALFLTVFILFTSCAARQTGVTSDTDHAYTDELSTEQSSTAGDPAATAATSFETSALSETHEQVLKRIYDEAPIVSQLSYTMDFRVESIKAYITFLLNIGTSKKEVEEKTANKHYEALYEESMPLVDRIDPFSETMLPVDTPEQIVAGTEYKEILDRYGLPNYRILFPIQKDPNVPYHGYSIHDLEMDTFWFLEDGSLLRIISDGTAQREDQYIVGTSMKAPWFNTIWNFTVRSCEVLSLEEFFDLAEYYCSIPEKLSLSDTALPSYRYNIHENGEWFEGVPWPEIFVTKYGIE